jgi:hypothetical protein
MESGESAYDTSTLDVSEALGAVLRTALADDPSDRDRDTPTMSTALAAVPEAPT